MTNKDHKNWLNNFFTNYNLLQHWTSKSSRLGVLVAYQHKMHRKLDSDPKTVFIGSCVLHPKDCLLKLGVILNPQVEINAATFSLTPQTRKNIYHSESALMIRKAIANARGKKNNGKYTNNNRFINYWYDTDLSANHPLRNEFDVFLGRVGQYFKIEDFWVPKHDEQFTKQLNTKSPFNYKFM